MAAIVTKYDVGRQAAGIRRSFTPGVNGLGQEGSGVTRSIIDAASQFIQSRWGQQRGTITYDPVTGEITQKQAADYPIQTQAPTIYGGQTSTSVQAPEGFATGLASGTTIALLLGGVVVLVMLMKK